MKNMPIQVEEMTKMKIGKVEWEMNCKVKMQQITQHRQREAILNCTIVKKGNVIKVAKKCKEKWNQEKKIYKEKVKYTKNCNQEM